MFKEILYRITPRTERQDTFMRKALESGLRLAKTISFLATGKTKCHIGYCCWHVWGHNSRVHGRGYRLPNDPQAMEGSCIRIFSQVAISLYSLWYRWQAHCRQSAPRFRILLLQLQGLPFHSPLGTCWRRLQIYVCIDVGANGSTSDAEVFGVTDLCVALEDYAADLPPPEPLPGDDKPMPYFIVGDNAFPMREWLQKPFPHRDLARHERNYNYRLSRARRVVENVFGILANR